MTYKIKTKLVKTRKGSFKFPNKVTSKGEARDVAVEFQEWGSRQSLSYGELAVYSNYFVTLGRKFGLTKEFKENGII